MYITKRIYVYTYNGDELHNRLPLLRSSKNREFRVIHTSVILVIDAAAVAVAVNSAYIQAHIFISFVRSYAHLNV